MGSKSLSRKNSSEDVGNSSGGDPPPFNSAVFSEGERVLPYQSHLIYEAKVQKTEFQKKERKYFIHYLGWKKSWDEWVAADQLLKHTKENVLKQQSLLKKQGVVKNTKSERGGNTIPKSSAEAKADEEDNNIHVSREKKWVSDSAVEKVKATVEKPVKIQMPASLRKQLVDDWESVTQQNKLVKLPRSPTVDEILARYRENKSKKDPENADSIGVMLKGLRCYFDKALALMLLYKEEHSQFNEAVSENASPWTVYTVQSIYFVSLLPKLLSFLYIDSETSTRLQQRLLDFLKFLQTIRTTFLLSTYSQRSKSSQSSGKVKEVLAS